MSYEIATIENDGKHVRTYSDSYGEKYVFKVTTTEGALAQVAKQKPDTPPQKGEVYLKLKSPPDNAPEGALPTLQERDQENSPPPLQSSHNGSGASTQRSYGKSPEEQKAIQRQHSQEMAIRMVAELRELDLRPDGLDSATAAIAYVKTLTDHFEKDIAL